jgi:peroxiredoxin
MSVNLVPGAKFPDFELKDDTGILRRLSEIQGRDNPMVVLISRGRHCPREAQHHRSMATFYDWCGVAFTELVTIAANDVHDLHGFKIAVGAHWPFLSDADRVVQRTLDIKEYTDPVHDPLVPHTIVLAPGLIIEKVYVGYWFWGRPSPYDLWADLRTLTKRIRTDYDPTVPEVRAAYQPAGAAGH